LSKLSKLCPKYCRSFFLEHGEYGKHLAVKALCGYESHSCTYRQHHTCLLHLDSICCAAKTTDKHTHRPTYERYIVGKVHYGENPCVLVGRCGENTHTHNNTHVYYTLGSVRADKQTDITVA